MAVTTGGNTIIKEDISEEDTKKELQISKYNLTAYDVKSEHPNLELAQFWPESSEENLIERILVQQPEKCDADTIKLEDRDDVVLQELVPYWPITDTVKMGMHVFSEQSEVKTEFEQGLFAEKSIISERCTNICQNGLFIDDDKIITENFSKNYLSCSVENNTLLRMSECNDLDRNGQCSKNVRNECKCKVQNSTVKHTKAKCHICDICKKSFPYLSKLARHRMIHEEMKNFSCNICSKSFRHSSSLLKHKLTHSNNKNVNCNV